METIAVVLLVAFALWRCEPFARQLLAQRDRALQLRETEILKPGAPRLEPPPAQMLIGALQWGDEWARDQAVSRLMEIWQEEGGDPARAMARWNAEQGTFLAPGGSAR